MREAGGPAARAEGRRFRPRASQAIAETAAVLIGVIIIAGMGVYASRREVAVALADNWLAQQGLAGTLKVERLDADGFTGSLLIGPESDPDLAIERVEVDLQVAPGWSQTPFALTTRSIRLVRPRLKAEFGAAGLTFGRLDPVVRDFLARPPSGDAPGPVVRIEDGAVRLATDYGAVALRGSALVDDGRLVRLDGRTPPARLAHDGVQATLGPGTLRLAGVGERLSGRATLGIAALSGAGIDVEGGAITLDVDAPYPGEDGAALDGPLTIDARLDSRTARTASAAAKALRANMTFRGQVSGPLTAPSASGTALLTLAAASAEGGGVQAAAPEVRATASRLTLARNGDGMRLSLTGAALGRSARAITPAGLLLRPDLSLASGGASFIFAEDGVSAAGPVTARLRARSFVGDGLEATEVDASARTSLAALNGTAPLTVEVAADRFEAEGDPLPIALAGVRARFAGPASLRDGVRWTASGAAEARDALDPAGAATLAARVPVLSGETSHADALQRAFVDFALRAPALSLAVADGRTTLSTAAPMQMQSASGARFTLIGRPLFAAAGESVGGSATLTAAGGGLPTATLALNGWSARRGVLESPVRLTASGLDAAIARNATATATGRATLAGDRFTFVAAGCIPVTAAEIEFGESDLTDATAEVCPTAGAPLVSTDTGGYRLQGAFRRAGLAWPISETDVAEASGTFDARGDAAALTRVDVRLAEATASDRAIVKRYEPIRLSGGVAFADGVWRGRFEGATSAGQRLGAADVTHVDATGSGGAVIDARGIAFAEGGLQPGALTPLVGGISTGASGTLDFVGRLDWTPEGSTSSGRLTTHGLNFASPAGAVSAVTADIELVSLAPLISAPDQRITIREVDAVTELTDLTTVFTLLEEEIRLSTTEFAVAGGRVRFEPLIIPLRPDATYTGALVVDGVQLGELAAAAGLGESMMLDAVVDGRIPFEIGPGRVRFADGRLASGRPGRLEIRREALTGVSAAPAEQAGAPGAPAPSAAAQPVNAIQDFAYQAMENLTFASLELSVNSLPEGRLGLLFKVRGEHDPKVAEEARVGILDAILGRAFDKRIPLPDGTPVNLTLDTTLNFDDLLQAWLDIARRRVTEVDAASPPRSTPVQPTPAYGDAMTTPDTPRAALTKRMLLLAGAGALAAACTPTVKVEVAPINIYAKLDANVRVQLDKEVRDLIQQNPNLF